MTEENTSITIFDGLTDLSAVPIYPVTKEDKEMREMIYRGVLERVLDIVASGANPMKTVDSDPRGISYARFLRWVRSDKLRLARYHEAQEIAAEILAIEQIEIADGEFFKRGEVSIVNDASRDALRINSRKWICEKYNKQRYGQSKHLDVSSTTFDENTVKSLTNEELDIMIAEGEAERKLLNEVESE